MRGPCFNCTRKHLSAASALMSEIGYNYLNAFKAIGQLGEAADEIIGICPEIYIKIYNEIINFIKSLNSLLILDNNIIKIKINNLYSINILELIKTVTEVNILYEENKLESIISLLPSCEELSTVDRVVIHLSQAYVLDKEVMQGYPLHGWLAVGHMAEASDLLLNNYDKPRLNFYPEIASRIRELRLEYMDSLNECINVETWDVNQDLLSVDLMSVINDIEVALLYEQDN